jgi:hypothetical protein
MRAFHSARLAALLSLSATLAAAQEPGAARARIYVPSQRVPITALPPPRADAHGHPPDNRTGTPPCGGTRYTTVYIPCAGSQGQPGTTQWPGSNSGSNSGDRQPPIVGGGRRVPTWPAGFGVGLFDRVPIWSLSEPAAHEVNEQLNRNGPQFPESLRMSNFRVTGFAKGLWPVVVDYEAEQGGYVLLTVVTQNAPPAEAILAVPQTGRRLQLLRLPAEFGTTLKSATFSIDATASATDPEPRYLRIYGFGCGPKAVGSVAIDNLRFGPGAVTASDPETHFGFHTHTMFDKMKAEFMQIAMVDHSIEGQLFDNKKIDRRVAEGESINDQWSAKKAKTGPIQFRVRGWMTVRGDNDGGDWVSAFSPDLVFKQ